ncbi:MAG TPA: hypothetical protein VL974_07725 [Magnetospirillum sp.]|jgi:hypothetical protein|nr:hypothetical protein [Magnetospirillum sp.]
MSVSAVAPTPFYQDPERLPIGLPKSAESTDQAAASADGKHLSMFAEGDDAPSFWDLLDVINPLQHIPIVNDIYRDLTGDKIGVGARLLGGTLFGGPIGLAAATVNCLVEESTGKDTGEHLLALFKDDEPESPQAPAPTMVADSAKTDSPAAAPAVSSSPAQAAAPSATAAPVIALPQAGGTAGGSQPMVFTLDGMQPAPIAPVAAEPAATAATPAAAVAVAQAAPRPLIGPQARVMPTPARVNAGATPLTPVTVPVSGTSARSNVPVTGRAPNAASAVAAQKALAAQPNAGNNPMLPPVDAQGQTAAGPDWFTAAWGQALDKYQRANQLNGKNAAGSTTSTLE